MANEKHVKLLKRSIKEWNRWREKQREIRVDLIGANLIGANLIGANLSEANLNRAKLGGANLNRANLVRANLVRANLVRANLSEANLNLDDLSEANLSLADLSEANLSVAKLSGTKLSGVKLSGANLSRANLVRADLSDADLSDTDLRGADLSRARLNLADLRGADLSGAYLIGADLSGAKLGRSNLSGANLSEAYLIGANLYRSDLSGAKLRGVDLSRADLSRADLSRADLSQANLSQADLDGTILIDCLMAFTILAFTDLSTVHGLDTIRHLGKSGLDLQTVILPHGPVRTALLRGVGYPETMIEYYDAIFTQPIQFYSCFISYTQADEVVAWKLYNDLQKAGIRCFFAPHDLKPGEYYHKRIDKEIQVHDKLLLLLSEQSVQSAWVEHEVMGALGREKRERRDILFPLRLDDTVMETQTDWARALRETRHIGDMACWQRQEMYQSAFQEVVRHLTVGLIHLRSKDI